jgi:hypothetical protein
MKTILSVENIHLFTGIILITAGVLSYQSADLSMMLSWSIFGAMYISMSDIGECTMCTTEKASKKHKIRIFAAYLGAILSIWLFIDLIIKLISS